MKHNRKSCVLFGWKIKRASCGKQIDNTLLLQLFIDENMNWRKTPARFLVIPIYAKE